MAAGYMHQALPLVFFALVLIRSSPLVATVLPLQLLDLGNILLLRIFCRGTGLDLLLPCVVFGLALRWLDD